MPLPVEVADGFVFVREPAIVSANVRRGGAGDTVRSPGRGAPFRIEPAVTAIDAAKSGAVFNMVDRAGHVVKVGPARRLVPPGRLHRRHAVACNVACSEPRRRVIAWL